MVENCIDTGGAGDTLFNQKIYGTGNSKDFGVPRLSISCNWLIAHWSGAIQKQPSEGLRNLISDVVLSLKSRLIANEFDKGEKHLLHIKDVINTFKYYEIIISRYIFYVSTV